VDIRVLLVLGCSGHYIVNRVSLWRVLGFSGVQHLEREVCQISEDWEG